MASFYVIFVLLIQSLVINSEQIPKYTDELEVERSDNIVGDCSNGSNDFFELLFGPNGKHLTPSVMLMEEATKDSDKTPEEQIEAMKKVSERISKCVQSELVNLLSFALDGIDKSPDTKTERKRRATESPMDSTKLVMRLLKHIKANNEHQNIAIEKMMSAQEIADKFGIEFNPDPEIISDLATAANEQAKELQSLYEDASQRNNVPEIEQVSFVPLEQTSNETNSTNNSHYYHYHVYQPQQIQTGEENVNVEDNINTSEEMCEHLSAPKHVHHVEVTLQGLNPAHSHCNVHPQFETQIIPPVTQPVSQRPPVFYEPIMTFTPAPDFYPQQLPTDFGFEEPEPELVGEEYEEIVSSKVTVDKGDEPGAATVNHVMTYTLSEKAHFKKPEIQSLPQQMQYYFLLM